MLKVSKKWSYALKATIYLAKEHGQLIHVSSIAESENIPEALLRRIISDLDKAQLVETVKGRNGGVKMSREIKKISVYDILSAIWEELWLSNCSKGIFCDQLQNCATTRLYNNLQWGFNSLLKMYTLDKII